MAFKTFGSREEKDDYINLENNKYCIMSQTLHIFKLIWQHVLINDS